MSGEPKTPTPESDPRITAAQEYIAAPRGRGERTMTDLLKRWAELEPGRCSTGALAAWVTLSRGEHPVALTVTTLARERAIILAAVIEAIEARDWWWDLHQYRAWPHLVRGHVGPDPLSAVPRRGEGPTPAAALLTAYLAALETETNQ